MIVVSTVLAFCVATRWYRGTSSLNSMGLNSTAGMICTFIALAFMFPFHHIVRLLYWTLIVLLGKKVKG